MRQAIAHPVWKMIWTTTLKTGPWSNKPCMGPTSLCIKFSEPKQGVGPVREKWDPGSRWDLGGVRAGLVFPKEKRNRGSLRVPRFPGKMHVRVPAGPRSCGFTPHPVWVIQC